jgi:rhodanese-related sulfurtransferase
VALRLKAKGIANVRPLLGGVEAWVALGYGLQPVAATTAVVALQA